MVRLTRVSGGTLHVENVDVLDGTPLLDIKPYVPEFDAVEGVSTGWAAEARRAVGQARADDRFR